MALSIEEIRERLKNRGRKKVISRAIMHQNRLKFHAETMLTANISQPMADFFAFVSNLLPEDKVKIIKALFRYPVKTNEICAICFDKLSRIFDGRNPVYNYQFTSPEQRDDWETYRTEVLREPQVWSTKGWDFFKTEINSILIVDLPIEQKDSKPSPYFYWLPIGSVVDFKADRSTGRMYYIIFRQDDGRIAVIDDESYRIFKAEGNVIGDLIVENKHDLGYCPAKFFWSEPISLSEPDIKASPLTKELESLDWYLFYHLSKRHLDLYGSYPIYSGYAQECDWSNEINGDKCNGGYIVDAQGHYKYDQAGLMLRCPKCGNKHIAGAGTFVEVPVPREAQNGIPGQADLRNPVQMLAVDRQSLDYNVAEEDRLRLEIITAVVGTNEEVTTRDALNEQQIKANFESQTTILSRVKKGFEEAQAFVDETCCRLRYGKAFVSATINYGTDFYVFDPADLRNRYKMAKENGASEAELDALQSQILETEYRNNPIQLQRMLVLAEVEPFRHLTKNEVIELYEKGIITEQQLRVKLNFNDFIRRFERENTNILDFGAKIPFAKKIDSINQALATYANESITK